MAQGKEFTKEQREIILESIKPYLQMGYSVNKACILAEQDPSVVYKWIEKDEALAKKIASWRNMVTALARKNVVEAMQGNKEKGISPDVDLSKWWLERKEKKEFGRNIDVTTDGESIKNDPVQWIVVKGNELPKEEEKTDEEILAEED